MSTKNWIANAQARPDVWWATPADVHEGDSFTLTINGKDITVIAGANDSSGTATSIDAAGVVKLLYEAILATSIAEWQEVTATMGIVYGDTRVEAVDSDGTTLVLTGPADGKPLTITSSTASGFTPVVVITPLVEGVAGKNEKQTVSIPAGTTGGTFTVAFAGQTTSALAYNVSAADFEDALEALSNIAPGDVAVTGASPIWVVEFKGTYAQTNVPLMVGDGASLTGCGVVTIDTVTNGGGTNPSNEIQEVRFITSGLETFRMHYKNPSAGDEYSASFRSNGTEATIKAAMESVLGETGVINAWESTSEHG